MTGPAMPRPPIRLASDLAILAWLAVQVGVPLAFYASGGGPDERFAWRMFSSERLTRCRVSAFETLPGEPEPVDLSVLALVQRGWISHLSRGQPAVVDAFLSPRCETDRATLVSLRRRCAGPAGGEMPAVTVQRRCREAPP